MGFGGDRAGYWGLKFFCGQRRTKWTLRAAIGPEIWRSYNRHGRLELSNQAPPARKNKSLFSLLVRLSYNRHGRLGLSNQAPSTTKNESLFGLIVRLSYKKKPNRKTGCLPFRALAHPVFRFQVSGLWFPFSFIYCTTQTTWPAAFLKMLLPTRIIKNRFRVDSPRRPITMVPYPP